MAVAEVSPTHENTVGALLKGFENKIRGDAPGTHYPNHPDIRRVLQPTDPGQISTGVSTPVAAKGNNFGFKYVCHCCFSFAFSFWNFYAIAEFSAPD
jgi:hypothetical protein